MHPCFSLLRQASSYFSRCEITSARQKKSRAFYRQIHAVQFMSTDKISIVRWLVEPRQRTIEILPSGVGDFSVLHFCRC
jgi:hypothetical protein